MKTIVILMCFSVFGGIAALADDFNVKGRLVGAEGEPLPYANVLVVNAADSSYVKGAITGEDGTFSVDLQAGEYLMKFTHLGYKDVYEILLSGKTPNGIKFRSGALLARASGYFVSE